MKNNKNHWRIIKINKKEFLKKSKKRKFNENRENWKNQGKYENLKKIIDKLNNFYNKHCANGSIQVIIIK